MNKRLLACLLAFATTAAVAQADVITYRSKELGFVIILESASSTSIAVFDHALVAARRESGDKPAEPKALHLLNVKQGVAGRTPLGFACSAVLGSPGAQELLAHQRAQVRDAVGLSEVLRLVVNGLRGYAVEYEVAGIGSAFFAFDSEPWAVVCGGTFDRATRAAFRRVIESLSALQ